MPTWIPRGCQDDEKYRCRNECVLGGMGSWSGPAREVKLDSRSMKHETVAMKQESKHETKMQEKQKQILCNTPVGARPSELCPGFDQT